MCPPGIYNVTDDEPAPVSQWLPVLAAARVGAKPPLRVPAWLGRLVAGEAAVSMMTQIRGCVQRQGQAGTWRELAGWPTWRDGFRQGLDRAYPADRAYPGREAADERQERPAVIRPRDRQH